MNVYLSFSKHCWQYLILVTLQEKSRSFRPGVFCKKCVFENFANLFSCEFSEIFKNTLFHRTPSAAASEKLKMFCQKRFFLEILINSQENTCARVSFLQPYECNFIKIEFLTQVFSCEFCKHISKNTFFTERIRWLLL